MLTRRSFLAFLAASTGTLAGCAAKNANAQPPSPDDALRARATASARTLAALYEVALNNSTVDHAEATLYRGHHLAHVQRLTNSPGSASPATEAAASNTAPSRADLAAAERAASSVSAADVNAASGDLAALLASIAACRSLHAQSLDPSQAAGSAGAPPLTAAKSSSGEPLQAVLSAEHAVIFAFGALGPHLTGSQRTAARAAFDLHREQRDALTNTITTRGSSPLAAEASYESPFHITDATSACRLAALVESRLAAVCAQTVSASSGGDRTYAAWALTQAALRAQTWGAPVTAFPGLDT